MIELPTIQCPSANGPQQWECIPYHWLVPATASSRSNSVAALPRLGGPIDPDRMKVVQPTAFHVCRTQTDLHVKFGCVDRDIWGTFTKRDDPLYEEEVVEVFLCPTGDLRHYYEFEVSPRNVIFDAKIFSPDLYRRTMQVETSWDCPDLQTSVTVDGTLDERTDVDRSWTVDIAIPFAAFPEVAPPQGGDVWRGNFYRIDRADPPEFTAWSPTEESPANFHVPERFGYIEFE